MQASIGRMYSNKQNDRDGAFILHFHQYLLKYSTDQAEIFTDLLLILITIHKKYKTLGLITYFRNLRTNVIFMACKMIETIRLHASLSIFKLLFDNKNIFYRLQGSDEVF
jgi:hypothetical protein